MVITPTANIAAGSIAATITFGKPWYKAGGAVQQQPVCVSQQVGSGASGITPLTVSAVTSTSVTWNAAAAMTAGVGYPYAVNCSGDLEK